MNSALHRTLRCGDQVLTLGERTHVMAIVNVTPDSFSDGGRYRTVDDAYAHAMRAFAAGAAVVDIGGESTRPGAQTVAIDEEIRRVIPVIERLVRAGERRISVDTRNAATARAALGAGASWLNDVSAGCHDDAMPAAMQQADAVVLMHQAPMTPGGLGDAVVYDDVVQHVAHALRAAVLRCGVPSSRVIVDPGLGFGKSVDDNLKLVARAGAFADVGAAVLLGPSRKRFLGAITGRDTTARDAATHAVVAVAAQAGVDFVRVHDAPGAVDVCQVVAKLAACGAPQAR